MSKIPFIPPSFEEQAFNCPDCHAYAAMYWGGAHSTWKDKPGGIDVEPVEFARCTNCRAWSVWYEEEMIFPKSISVDDPNDDLSDDVKKDYLEAATILQDSPRGAGALLRLALQKLVDSLVEGKNDLNEKIGILVQRGLDKKIQQALDIVRVIGNEAVHPGQIDLNDSPQIVHYLFKLVNIIAQKMITEPKEIDEYINYCLKIREMVLSTAITERIIQTILSQLLANQCRIFFFGEFI